MLGAILVDLVGRASSNVYEYMEDLAVTIKASICA
jgi:hypothetical protein